ncbi:type I-E CRISPR-associated endoribonuclease Cas2e [Nocardiopsis alba]|uniref:type I-E CRISPR-associated endoribonuclease Cas2e n=1 Tax=Nocardiopsis alba TaxID=53437 RepID=UPI0003480194|nr:type I-E CRISPR-associated endoribonuclease Cas2e [Nocardiopsis alba]
MTVIILTNCPAGLRGHLTRWLLQIAPNVFIGKPSARVREVLWEEVRQYAGNGRALLVHATDNEQGFAFETFEHKWRPVDHEGMTLIQRPKEGGGAATAPVPVKKGWSKASKRRRFGR